MIHNSLKNNFMTLKQAYTYYYAYCRDVETWTWDFIQENLKKSWIDYEQFNREEFKDKLLNDDKFNERWGQGCTRELTHKERYLEYNKIYQDRCTAECYTKEDFDNKNIPTRTIISEI